MYRRAAHTFILMAMFLVSGTATAQRAPRPETVLRQWLSSQTRAERRTSDVSLTEETERVLDGPFGKRVLRIRSRLSGAPRVAAWDRDVLAASANGRMLTPGEYERLERMSDHLAGARAERLLEALLFPATALNSMRPVGRMVKDRMQGVPAWRFDVAPPASARIPVQRMTVWIGTEHGNLMHSRALLDRAADGSTLRVDTDYQALGGLDVPARRHVEGTIRTRRRLRTFTLLLRVDSEYSDYRFDRR